MKPARKTPSLRAKVLFTIASLGFLGVTARAFQLQILMSDKLKKLIKKQGTVVLALPGKRGNILDRKGRVLATTFHVWSAFADPYEIENSKIVARKVAKILRIPYSRVLEKITKKGRRFVWLKRHLSRKEYKKLKEMGMKGIYFVKEYKRFYPYSNLFSHVLGFVGIDLVGLEGIEATYDEILRGDDIRIIVRRDAKGRLIFVEPPREPRVGRTIVISLDLNLQRSLERHLKAAIRKFKAKGGIGVVMEPETGEILAMISKPDFDPERFEKYAKSLIIRNRVHQFVFEPGSSFKIFPIAFALDEGIISPSDIMWCEEGKWEFSGKMIHDVKALNWASISEVLEHSSNICAAKIALIMGPHKLYEAIRSFGFGEKTEIDLIGEEKGILRDWKEWQPIDIATIGFGQGIAVTAIQIVTAISALVNGGYIVMPHILKRIEKMGVIEYTSKPVFVRKVISEETSNIMKEFMLRAVEWGTGIKAKIPGYKVGGKTGTAQKLENGEYSKEKYFSCFTGFVDESEGKIVAFIGIDEPKGKIYGGEVAAPIFKNFTEEYLVAYSIPPEVKKEKEEETKIQGKPTLLDVIAKLKNREKELVVKGYGYVERIKETKDKVYVYLKP